MSMDGGASLEQAMLPETTEPHQRTRLFGTYNAVGPVTTREDVLR